MSRFNTQPVARTGARSAAQARRLIAASQGPAKFILETTIKLVPEQAAKGPIQDRRATESFRRGDVVVLAGESFYLVESPKFIGRFYIVLERGGRFQCSSREDATAAQCIGLIREMTAQVA